MESAYDLYNKQNARLFNYQLELQVLGHIIKCGDDPMGTIMDEEQKKVYREKRKEDQINLLTSLRTEHFNDLYHSELFEIIQNMFVANLDVNTHSVSSYVDLKSKPSTHAKVKGAFANTHQSGSIVSVGNAIAILRELLKNRKIYEEVLNTGGRMFSEGVDTDEIIEHMTNVLISVEGSSPELSMKEIAKNFEDDVFNKLDGPKGLKIGLNEIDVQYGGIKKDRYYTVGGMSGSGKTAFTIDMIERLVSVHKDKIKILFFSLEMSQDRIFRRLISRKTGLTEQTIEGRMKKMTPEQEKIVQMAKTDIATYPMEIVYKTMNCNQLKLRMERFARQNPDKHLVVILDHIGLVAGSTNDMRINTILASQTMKSAVRDHGYSAFVLTQFVKEAEGDDNRKYYFRPQLRFIMESGRIREDSDTVMLLWRPEVYFRTIPFMGNPEWPTEGKLIILNEKNRDGHAPNDMIFDQKISCYTIGNFNQPF